MIERALIEYVLNALWQVPLLAGSAWLLLRMIRPAPLIQHYVWLSVLGLAVLLPLNGMTRTDVSDVSDVSVTRLTGTVTQAQLISREEVLVLQAPNNMPQARRPWFAFLPLFTVRTGNIRLTPRTAHWLLRLYVAAIAIGLFRIGRAWCAARKLVGSSREISLCDRDRAALEDYGDRLGIKLPQLRESGEVSSPMVVGVTAPVLLLPEGFAHHTENEIRAALCHELAHIQRRDYLLNVACQVAALPLAWHPVVDWIQQRIRMTREMVCDAMAAEEMESHLGYAKCLLALAHSMLGGRGMSAQAEFLGLFGKHTLEERVMRLVDTTTMSMRARAARVASGAAMMIATGVIAVTFHVTPTMAQANALPPATQNPPAGVVTQPSVAADPKSSPPSQAVTADQATPAKPKKHVRGRRNWCDGDGRELSQAEQQRIDDAVHLRMDDLQRQMERATQNVNRPEFRERMEDLQKYMAEVAPKLNSPEFKQRMDDLQKQMAKATADLNSSESKQGMEYLQKYMAEVAPKLNSPEFKQRMDDLQKQMAKATADLNSSESKQRMEYLQEYMAEVAPKLNSPEFKQRMDDLQEQMAEVASKLDSRELERQMKDAQKEIEKATERLNSPEFRERMQDLQRQMEELNRRSMDSPNP